MLCPSATILEVQVQRFFANNKDRVDGVLRSRKLSAVSLVQNMLFSGVHELANQRHRNARSYSFSRRISLEEAPLFLVLFKRSSIGCWDAHRTYKFSNIFRF